jgi:hypothetical protein
MLKKLREWIINNVSILQKNGNGLKALIEAEKKIAKEEDEKERKKYGVQVREKK